MDTGMVRKIDDLGRIVLPSEMRNLFHIRQGDQLAISVEGDTIKLRKLAATCSFCGSTEKDKIRMYKDRGVCKDCIQDLAS